MPRQALHPADYPFFDAVVKTTEFVTPAVREAA